MTAIQIKSEDDLRTIAFKVCTVLEQFGVTAVLTGGSAATVYAPDVYQSRDADFIAYVVRRATDFRAAIAALGFTEQGGTYFHPAVPTTLDFPGEDIRIGSELVERYATMKEAGFVLHILTPTDCVRDRLASFFWYRDRSALAAARGVAQARPSDVDLAEIKDWAARHGEAGNFQEFIQSLNDAH